MLVGNCGPSHVSLPAAGKTRSGSCYPNANRHLVSQVLGGGVNGNFSLLVDQGNAHTHVVEYTSKAESHNTEVQKILTRLVAAAVNTESGQ